MGELADRLARVTVQVTSPDGNLRARVRGRRFETVELRLGSYRRYRERELEHQLARTATLLFTGRERAVAQIIADAGLRRRTDPADARDPAQRRYLDLIRTMPVVGTGPGERVRFRSAGMIEWTCRIEDGTLRRLDEAEFATETVGAAADFLRRRAHETRLAKDECYGLAIPALTREREARARSLARGEPAPYTEDAW
ncbi:hypothetical protein Afil01_19430 [Actinorhabdospora filicis]|uniref:Uncharacterized protein n=1 Tax=Actinorhabdospora filicis TaxID=1785913 RepID=A0A9W6W948_9ACTN|nr:hypothetical protein [Actinorhabdospora filicis]GLZ77136.1 hypothetical protein Afil01_19430 [Actinorhabdospora filicis]